MVVSIMLKIFLNADWLKNVVAAWKPHELAAPPRVLVEKSGGANSRWFYGSAQNEWWCSFNL